jgi:hypothetical protein
LAAFAALGDGGAGVADCCDGASAGCTGGEGTGVVVVGKGGGAASCDAVVEGDSAGCVGSTAGPGAGLASTFPGAAGVGGGATAGVTESIDASIGARVGTSAIVLASGVGLA